MMDRICAASLFGWHKIEPRFDHTPPDGKFSGPQAAKVIEAGTAHTYVRDICVRCGQTVERPKVKT